MYLTITDTVILILVFASVFLSIQWSLLIVDRLICLINHQHENIDLKKTYRQSMILRIRNLFEKTSSEQTESKLSSCLSNYRCPICWSDRSKRWIALGCGHLLCSLCTQHLIFGRRPYCPTCRSPMLLSDLTLLYI